MFRSVPGCSGVPEFSGDPGLSTCHEIPIDSWPIVYRSLDGLSTDYRPIIDRLSTDCRPVIDQLSTESRLI